MKRILAVATAFLIIALFLFPLAATFSSGEADTDGTRGDERNEQDSRGNPPPPPKKNSIPRAMSVLKTDNSVTVISSGKTDGEKNTFLFTAEQKDGLTLHYNYFRLPGSDDLRSYHQQFIEKREFREKNDPPSERESEAGQGQEQPMSLPHELGLSLKFFKLREFNDSDDSISQYDLSRASYEEPRIKLLGSEERPAGMKIWFTTTDHMFNLIIHIYGNYTDGNAGIVGSVEIKFDIVIRNYPFAANDSFMALESSLAMPDAEVSPFLRELRQKNDNGDAGSGENGAGTVMEERGVGYEQDAAALFFSWATNVTVDGEEYDVATEYSGRLQNNGRSVETISFIYPAGSKIFHDPKLGVSDLLDAAEDTAERIVELVLSWSTGLGAGIAIMVAVGVKHKPAKFDWEE